MCKSQPLFCLINSSLDLVSNSLDLVSNSLEWKLIGNATGSNYVALPVSFREVFIELTCESIIFAFSIPYITLTETEKGYRNGWAHPGSTGVFKVSVSKQKCRVTTALTHEGDVISKCLITVYYR